MLQSNGWPWSYNAAAKCEMIVLSRSQETQIAIMDVDMNNRAVTGCNEQDDYIQIKGMLITVTEINWRAERWK